MALSRIVVLGTGATNTFNVPFTLGYINEDDITCWVEGEVDGLGDPIYRTITFNTPTNVTISGAAPALNVRVIFTRTVDRDALLVDFENGDILNEDNLSLMQKQMIMLVHEALDGRFEQFDNDIDAGGFTVFNLRTPDEDDDDDVAANKGYVDARIGLSDVNAAAAAASAAAASTSALVAGTHSTNAAASAAAAAASASSAADSSTGAFNAAATANANMVDAGISAAQALSYKEDAEDAAGAAGNSQTAAASSATAAAGSATAAAGSASTASTQASNAASSASAASTSASNAATSATNAASSATAANTAKTNAETAETNAETAEALAEKWASELEDVVVESGKYSAYHWAQKAQDFASGDIDASQIISGIINDLRMPTRIGAVAKTITDWNTATENGYYYAANGATNQPAAANNFGYVVAINSTRVIQFVFQNAAADADMLLWIRHYFSGAWGSWTRGMVSRTEMDTRYFNASNLSSGTVALARLPTNLQGHAYGSALDLNTLTTPGFYYWTTGLVNGPAGAGDFGSILVTGASNTRLQIVSNYTNNFVAMRTGQIDGGTGWQAWVTQYHTGNLVNATTSVGGLLASSDKVRLSRWGVGTETKTAAYTLLAGDAGKTFSFGGSSDYTVSMTAAATCGNGCTYHVKNTAAILVTLDPNGSETIDGASTLVLAKGQECFITSDGSNWHTVGYERRVFLGEQTVSGVAQCDITLPPGYRTHIIDIANLIPATDNVEIRARVSTNGGSSFDSGVNNYRATYQEPSGDATWASGVIQRDSGTIGGVASNTTVLFGRCTIYAARESGIWTQWSNELWARPRASLTSTPSWWHTSNWREATQVDNAFRIYASSGNISMRYMLWGEV